jgi:periplasmic protein TonB
MLVARLFVPLTIPQRPAAVAGPGSGLSLIVGGGLSLLAHLALITAIAGSSLATDAEAPLIGEATALPIMVSALATEEDAQAAPLAAPAPVTGDILPAPVVTPRRHRSLPRRHPVAAVVPPDLAPAPVVAVAVERTSLPSPVVEKTSASGRPRPQQVSPEVGRGLRLEDSYPQLPQSLRNAGFEHVVLLEVCVSVRGAVDEIRFASHTTGQLRQDLEQAIRGWRYRPLIKDGAPVPYCHQMRIQYRMT